MKLLPIITVLALSSGLAMAGTKELRNEVLKRTIRIPAGVLTCEIVDDWSGYRPDKRADVRLDSNKVRLPLRLNQEHNLLMGGYFSRDCTMAQEVIDEAAKRNVRVEVRIVETQSEYMYKEECHRYVQESLTVIFDNGLSLYSTANKALPKRATCEI
ncbi:MAG: hypothetical protein M9962_11375 [Oligoflexia bacterium]|nr:hypothetical protein [Oligoflexia bacterium]